MQIEYSSSEPLYEPGTLDSKKPLKKLEIKDFLSKGTYIDAKDSANNWCVAIILEVFSKEEKVMIRFDGWAEKWNEIFSFASKKLLPFRRVSQGYTGQPKHASREYQFKMIELQENKILMENILKSDFDALSCFQVTQILRGKLFIYIDNIMTFDYEDIEKNDMIKILDFIFLYIKLCCKYLKKFQLLYSQYSKGLSNGEAFLSEKDVALSFSLFEIIESLLYIFNENRRCQLFYVRYQKLLDEIHENFDISYKHTIELIPEENEESAIITEESDLIPKILLKFINYFVECGGLISLIRHFTVPTIEVEQKELFWIPYQCLDLLLKLTKCLIQYLNKTLQEEIVTCLKNEIIKRFNNLSEKEIKDLDKEFLMKVLNDCKVILGGFLDNTTLYEIIENLELDLAYKFLVSQYFEKRLKGINSINEIAERIEFTQKYGRNNESFYINMPKISICKYLNSEIFLNWIKEKKIIEILLGDSIHIEILKRCHDFLKFICRRKFMINEIIQKIWTACEGKHDSIIRCLYDIIIAISSNMNKESLAILYQKLKELDLRTYNELSLNLLKEFCENVINLSENNLESLESLTELTDEIIEEHFFGINILWKLILDDSSLSAALTEEAVGIFKNLIINPNCRILRTYYMTKSIKEIEKGCSVPQCLFIITRIIQTSCPRKGESESQIKSILVNFEKCFNLINLTIKDLYRYFSKIRNFNQDKARKSPAIFEEIFEGKHCHKINLELRLSLLELFANYALLSETHVDKLWDIFVVNAFNYQESVLYFKWLARQNETTKGEIHVILSKSLMFYQFKDILCDTSKNSFKLMQEEAFTLFYLCFVMVNLYERNLRINKKGKLTIMSPSSITGLSILWQIFDEAQNEKVIEKVSEVLSEIHLRILDNGDGSGQDMQARRDSAEKFTTYVMSLLKEACVQSKKLMINKAVYLLIVFFEKFEGKFFKPSNKLSNNYYHFMNAIVVLKPENVQKEIRVNVYDQIGSFRKKISEEFGIPLNQLSLMNKNEIVADSDDDEMTLREFGLGGIYLVTRKKNENEENYHPKHLISESQEYLDLLFKLLSEADSECLNNIWNLLMKLPSNEKIKKSLLNMEKSWNDLIDVKSFYKCLYCLQIIEELTFTNSEGVSVEKGWKENSEEYFENEWHMIFLASQGLEFLINLFINQIPFNFQTHLSKRYMCLLLKLIFFYQKRVNLTSIFQNDPMILSTIATKLLDTIFLICDYTIIREQNNFENCLNEKENFSKSYQSINGRLDNSKMPIFFIEEADILYYCQEFLLSITNCSFDLLELIYTYPNLEKILMNGLILSDNSLLKEKFSIGLSDLLRAYSISEILIKPHQFFVPIFLNKILDIAFQYEERSKMFFSLLIATLDEISINNDVLSEKHLKNLPLQFNFQLDFYSLIKKLVLLIKDRKSSEESPEKDILLTCSLNLLKVLLNYVSENIEEISLNLVDELLFNCLFIVKNGSDSGDYNCKCKTFNSRMAAFNLLQALSLKKEKNLQKILDFFIPILRDSDWRTKSISDWNITPKGNEKSLTGYVGLNNLGCICYMNSLVQQLFMIPSFRNFVIDVEDRNFSPLTKEDNALYQLKCMFLSLKESKKQFYNPRYFCYSFKDWEGNPTNVYEQRDVDEFFSMFMDRYENLTKGTLHETYIKETFGGQLSNEFICKDCPHYSEREEPFLAVSLQVKNKKTLEESLSSFVEGEILEGQNAYLCEQCDKKVTAVKRICLKTLPNHLILVLKRFEFDYDNMAKVKINDLCEFPMKINMEKYTQFGLRKKEKTGEEEDNMEKFPPGYFDYELKGIVIHIGNADSGHYYSFIQDREKTFENNDVKWYEFNDRVVRYFDPRDIPTEAFGGEDKWNYYVNNNTPSFKEMIKSAYMLFYDRVVPLKTDLIKSREEVKENDERISKTSQQTDNKIITVNPLEEFHLELIENNFKFHIHRNVFSQEFFKFITNVVMNREYTKNRDYLPFPMVYDASLEPKKHYDLELLKMGCIFLLTCVIREKERSNIIEFLPFITKQLKKNLPLCLWFINGLTNKQNMEELLLVCPIPDMRKFLTGLIRVSCSKIYKFECSKFKQYDKEGFSVSVLKNFMNLCINFIEELCSKAYDSTEFFKLFYHFSKISHELAIYLIQNDTISLMLRYFYFEISRDTPKFPPTNNLKVKSYNKFLLGQPKDIKKKIMTKIDEIKQKKKEKIWLENNNTNRLFMWRTVSYLLCFYRHNKNVERSPFQIGTSDFELSNVEIEFMMGSDENILNILNDANYKISVKAISSMFGYLSYENIKFSEFLLKSTLRGFKERDVNAFRPYFAIIKTLVGIKDSISELRVKKVMDIFLKFMNENSKYVQDAFYQQQFLFKLAGREELVRNYLEKNPDTISWIINWINDSELPNLNSNSMVKSNSLRFNRFHVPSSYQEYQLFCHEKINLIKKLMKGEFEANLDSWDSDDDFLEQNVKIGEKIDLYHSGLGYWISAIVEKNLGELLNISLIIKDKIHKNTVWKATDCDDLAPHFSMQERNVETTNSNTVLGLEIETRDSTEKNAGSNEESENEQPLLRGTNSLNSDVENTGDVLNTTNEI